MKEKKHQKASLQEYKGLPIDEDKYGHKAMFKKLLEEYPELTDPSKLVVEGNKAWILRDDEDSGDTPK